MAGIYLHIPYCKQACSYCDFHFSTSLKHKPALLEAMKKEMIWRQHELGNEPIDTIYFGGGTPSLLNDGELHNILELLYKHYNIATGAEITLEANPDDLTDQRIGELRRSPVNRLSIGVQSFSDEDLRFMNRAHNADEAWKSVMNARDAGFDNITIDLIYGVPTMSRSQWEQNLVKTASLGVPHVSAYCLTVEPRTALHHSVEKGKVKAPDEVEALAHFRMLMTWAAEHQYVHYEISNFGKEGYFSRHNTAYWQQKNYLGFGPAAHSYNGRERRWNVANNLRYIHAVEKGQTYYEQETLLPNDRFNEYIMTALRTIRGISEQEITTLFGRTYWDQVAADIQYFQQRGEIILSGNRLSLSEKGKFVADKIAAQLFVTD